MPERIRVNFEINGRRAAVEAWPMEPLLDLLRRELGLTGTKEGCGEGECGACAVLLNGKLANSCLIPAAELEGCRITTIEGIADDGRLQALQEAFAAGGGVQCGFCTPGMILAAADLLRRHPSPNDAEIREGLAGNLCRCTGYVRIVEAVRRAAL